MQTVKLAQIDVDTLQSVMPDFRFKGSNIGSIVSALIPYVFAAAGFLLLIFLVIGGLEFIFSLGDPKKTSAARGKITNALLGFLVVFAAYLIVQVVGIIFKLPDIQTIFK